jgi:hypothetical protein
MGRYACVNVQVLLSQQLETTARAQSQSKKRKKEKSVSAVGLVGNDNAAMSRGIWALFLSRLCVVQYTISCDSTKLVPDNDIGFRRPV